MTPGSRKPRLPPLDNSFELDDRGEPEGPTTLASSFDDLDGAIDEDPSPHPPSFAESQFLTIVRRQRIRAPDSLKIPHYKLGRVRSTGDPPHSSSATHYLHEFEFSGWGNRSLLALEPAEIEEANKARRDESIKNGDGVLNAWFGTGIAGVAVAGSPLYAYPAVVAAASVFAPISLLVASLLLSFWQPIMNELASALPQSGANYIYLLNSSTKNVALLGCTITLLDDVATAVVSAGTAAAYIGHSTNLPFSPAWLTAILIVGVGALGLLGLRGGARLTSAILAFHLASMGALFVAGAIYWGRHGNALLAENWRSGQTGTAGGVVRAVFNGVCIAFLGVTGFETTPDYIASLRPSTYPIILRNLQAIAIILNGPLMLLTFAVLPLSSILQNGTVLSSLALVSGGNALKILVTIDAVLILCAGVLTGIISAAALVSRLTDDRVLPGFFRWQLPLNHVRYVSLSFFIILSLVVWGVCGADLAVVSGMFAICFLVVMAFYPFGSLLLAASRPYLQRTPRPPLLLSFGTLALSIVLVAGNIVLSPPAIGYFVAYAGVLLGGLWCMSHRSWLMRVAWWFSQRAHWSRRYGPRIVGWMESLRGGPVVVFVKRDEIHRLFEQLLYCRNNEAVKCVKLVHVFRQVEDIPSELESNFQILDEAFPQITVDLVFVQGEFSSGMVKATAHRLGIPVSMCFVGCPREADLLGNLGVRIIGT